MQTEAFERELRETVDPDFSVKTNPNCPDVAGVHWRGSFLFTVPSERITDAPEAGHVDAMGNPHRTRPQALALAHEHMRRVREEPGYLEELTEPL